MKPNPIARIAVIILGIILIIFGTFHLMKPKELFGYVPSYLPGGIMWVYLTGVAFMLAGIAFILHKKVKLAGYLLALLLMIFVLTINLPNFLNAGDNEMKQMALVSMLKDTALAAFALYIGSNAKNL
jgi:putative oxidoreductase